MIDDDKSIDTNLHLVVGTRQAHHHSWSVVGVQWTSSVVGVQWTSSVVGVQWSVFSGRCSVVGVQWPSSL